MGQQQLLLIILGVIVVGIAVAVGITMFSDSAVNANRDAMVNDLVTWHRARSSSIVVPRRSAEVGIRSTV